jgi:hypothetical protein
MRVCGAKIAVLVALCSPATAFADDTRASIATLHVDGEQDRAEVVIDGDFEIPKYSIDALEDGKQVIIHVEDAVLGSKGLAVSGSSALIVRSSASTSARGVRITIQLTRRAAYRARSEEGKIRVSFDARDVEATDRAGELGSAAPRGTRATTAASPTKASAESTE